MRLSLFSFNSFFREEYERDYKVEYERLKREKNEAENVSFKMIICENCNILRD